MRDFKRPWHVADDGTTVLDSDGGKIAECRPEVAPLIAVAPVLEEFLRKGLPGGSGMERGDLARIVALINSLDR